MLNQGKLVFLMDAHCHTLERWEKCLRHKMIDKNNVNGEIILVI